jgi:hypothetical protein
MSDEFCAGVQILLKRTETNPEEFKEEFGKWSNIRNAVFNYKENGEKSTWLRGLNPQEIDALYEKLSTLYRAVLDEWVMKQVLAEPEEELKYKVTERYAHSWGDPRMLAQSSILGGGGSGQVRFSDSSGRFGSTTSVTTANIESRLAQIQMFNKAKNLGLISLLKEEYKKFKKRV